MSIDETRHILLKRIATIASVFAITAIGFVGVGLADQPDETLPGFRPEVAYEGNGTDNINLYSGDPGIVVPLGPAYQLSASASWQLKAFGSSKMWSFFPSSTCNDIIGNRTTNGVVHGYPTLGAGWTLDLGYVGPGPQSVSGDYHAPDGSVPRGIGLSRLRVVQHVTNFPACASLPCYTVEFPDGSTQYFDHPYIRPRPTHAVTDPKDFSDELIEGNTIHYGLGRIIDSFDSTVLTVQYDATHPNEMTSVKLYADQLTTISFHWITTPVIGNPTTGPQWRVLSSIDFPGVGSQVLTASFVFDYLHGSVPRNAGDTTHSSCPLTVPTTTAVPYLTSVRFASGATTLSTYGMAPCFQEDVTATACYPRSGTPDSDFDGAVAKLTLPTGGFIDYFYSITTAGCTADLSSCDDPELDDHSPGMPSFNTTGSLAAAMLTDQGAQSDPLKGRFLDNTAAVYERDEFSATGTKISKTTYNRYEFRPKDPVTGILRDSSLARQVVVAAATGNKDVSQNPLFFKTNHLFHTSFFQESTPEFHDGGVEIETRVFPENQDATGSPLRTTINCTVDASNDGTPVCGYRSARDGALASINTYAMSGDVRQSGGVTWFGDGLAANTGGNCAQATTLTCVQTQRTGYNSNSRSYANSTTSAQLPAVALSWTSRTTNTNWTPATGTNWLLDLFSSRTTTDSGIPQGPSNPSVGYSFNVANGFLNSTTQADGANGTITKTFQDLAATHVGDPTQATTVGSSSDGISLKGSFTDTRTFQHGLLLTSTRTGLTYPSFHVARDTDTGLVTASYDPNGLQTSYTYDALGRITQISRPGEVALSFCYFLPNSSLVGDAPFVLSKQLTGTATACSTDDLVPGAGSGNLEGYQYDDLGRVAKHIRRLPTAQLTSSYFAFQETRYDTAGHASFASEWTPCGTSKGATNIGSCIPSTGTQGRISTGYDVFGRPGTVTGADGTYSTFTYVDGAASTQTSVTKNSSGTVAAGPTATTTDPLGRVVLVTEPAVAGVSGSANDTSNAYNALDKLATVTQADNSLHTQTRTFIYDKFGFLRSEANPENGTSSYTSYDALGDVLSKTEGPGADQVVSSMAYDPVGRLKTLLTDEGRTYVQNTYDATIPSPPNPNYFLGHLTQSIGSNFLLDPGPQVTEQLGYGGVGGRLSKRIVTVGSDSDPNDGALVRDGESIATIELWTYNTLGLIDTYNHPRVSGITYQEDPSYVAGLPATAIAPGATVYSALSYLPYGGLGSWKAGNNVVTTIAQATNLMPRPISITAKSGATTLFASGNYSYDGAGNILAIGGDTFKYDVRSRLVSADYGFTTPTCTDSLANANRDQCFSYDRYGNLTGIAGTNPHTLAVDASTNRLTSQTYDTRGNDATSGGGFDGMNRITSGFGWDYLYDAAGERIAKFPDSPILRREMAKLITQARGEGPSATSCNGVDTYFYTDVACSDPDRPWIDNLQEKRIANGYGNGIYGPQSPVTRGEMSAFLAIGKLAPNPVPTFGTVNGVAYNCVLGGTSYFADVPPTDVFCATINYIASIGVTLGCGSDVHGNPIYCPTNLVPETQMMAFTRREWPNYLYVPRGTIYTLRDAVGRVATEMMSKPGSTSYPVNDFPVATTPTRDNVFLGNLLAGSNSSNTLGGPIGWSYYHSDHLGTPRLITGVEGTNPPLRYWPYGNEVSTNGITSQRLKFATMERDTENSHFFDHARSHDFNQGRFVSVDKAGAVPFHPLTWNRYLYANDNPLRLVDSNGREPLDANIRQFLETFYQANLSRVQVTGGFFSRVVTSLFGASGVTFGQHILLSRQGFAEYKQRSAAGIELTGHETKHTLQYNELGGLGFLAKYAAQFAKGGFSYGNIGLEKDADSAARTIFELLTENPGILGAIQQGTGLTDEEKRVVSESGGDVGMNSMNPSMNLGGLQNYINDVTDIYSHIYGEGYQGLFGLQNGFPVY